MGTYTGHLLTYENCKATMDTARNRDNGKPMANNTRLFDRGDHFALRLHNTDIIRVFPDGWVLSAGGWTTVTTKQRLNDWGPVGITQRDWTWYVGTPDGERTFHNGIFVDKDRGVWDTRSHYLYSLEQRQADDISEVVE